MGRRRRKGGPHGILVVDKARGPTSHDVVAKARRALNTGRIGHAGTLDPMATGVLVLGVGEGTKLVPWLTADDKSYVADVRLGLATNSGDMDGETVSEAPVPALSSADVQRAAEGFLGTHLQRVPALSAVRVDGERLYEKARRGEVVDAPERSVTLHAVAAELVDPQTIRVELRAAKGFYVRSFGEMLAQRLGTRGHLVALRRTTSGRFDLTDAVPTASLEVERGEGRESLPLLPLADAAARLFPTVVLDEGGLEDARHGRRVSLSSDVTGAAEAALVYGEGAARRLVALARVEEDGLHVVRGFPEQMEQ